MERIIFVDISHWQGRIGHQKLKNFGIAGAYVKNGEFYNGTETDDDKYLYNMDGLEDVGIPRGPYYFYHPGAGNSKQLRHFERLWKLRKSDFPPALDCEAHDGLGQYEVQRQIKNMLEEMEKIAGRKPVIYTSPGFWSSKVGNPSWSKDYQFWVAEWGDEKLDTKLFERVIIHQYTDKGKIPGCPTIDINFCLMSEDELRKFAQKEISAQLIAENRIKKNVLALSRANRKWLENQIK